MTMYMPGYYDSLTQQHETMPEWQRIERYEYCEMDRSSKKVSLMDKISGMFRKK